MARGADRADAARDSSDDGLLRVSEILGLELHADLVTLSGCSTGVGQVSGEGVMGFSRAFIHAGAASVLVSLWRFADDVATVQMEDFYRGLIRWHGYKARALAAGLRDTIAGLRSGRLHSTSGRVLEESPQLWAPFVLVGEAGRAR